MADVHNVFSENGICAVCRRRPVERWCDYVISYDNSVVFTRDYKSFVEINRSNQYETCDLPMCKECAKNVSVDRDLCPHHMSLHQKVKLPDEYQRRRQTQEKRKMFEEATDHE